MKAKCPNCNSEDDFATIEKAIGYSLCEFIDLDNNGRVEYTGESHFPESESIGIMCRNCDWEFIGDDWVGKVKYER